MALNILIDLGSKKTNWKKINSDLKNTTEDLIEIFPIPSSYNGSDRNYLGMSILNSNYSDANIINIKERIRHFLQLGCKVFELYTSNEFSESNVDVLVAKLFK